MKNLCYGITTTHYSLVHVCLPAHLPAQCFWKAGFGVNPLLSPVLSRAWDEHSGGLALEYPWS